MANESSIFSGGSSGAPSTRQIKEAMSMQHTGNTLLITGGGAGIGRELAQRFNDLGNTVIITGRRMEPLNETIAGRNNMHALVLDVDDPAAINAFAKQIVADYPELNVLVNNAGIMRYEDLSKTRDLGDAEAQITTNLLGPIRLTNALIDHLKSRPNPVVINLSSGLGFVPRADAGTYGATKAGIHSYTLSLRRQLQGQVKVIEIVPPAVQTELTPGQSSRDGYMPLDDFIDEVMANFLRQPVPDEILVQRVAFLRWAEREDRYEQTFETLNAHVAAAAR
ncbi:SDR family oxidoreductase [Pusillimonas sp. SM2304]|uniref:SDR family oxidoreductase n=1 Tax=Pusillimonas sp. SM2304 TaxID=3073241 RepID=UPI0028761271|nr:SDR family oxidoreductase [Pusillimonas sp. SM2304]MDS1139015.1 SDR family oxidoreductase [Pusillimonas sp. SM2304]